MYRDLLDDHEAAAKARDRIAREGWGARLLELQDPEGTWASALYSPKWTSTTYTLLLLHHFGLSGHHPAVARGVGILVDRARELGGGLTFARTIPYPETCITAMIVLMASWSGMDHPRIERAIEWLSSEQMPDGGWNCERLRSGSSHGSFHTSITVLEALGERSGRIPDPRLEEAMAAGRRFFLDHRLYHSHRTGQVADPAFTLFSFPPYWHFDALRGLNHFRASNAMRDPALAPAIDLVGRHRTADGRWPLQNVHRNRTWFDMERGGRPSRWNTLRALRVLRWWEGNGSAPG